MSSSPRIETSNPNPNPNPNDTWTIVSNKRNRNKPRKPPHPSPNSPQSQSQTLTLAPTPWTPLDSESDPGRHSKLHLKLQSSLQKLLSSKFYDRFLSQLHSPQIQSPLSSFPELHLVVYGIGSVESFETPRLQLSLALLLRRELGARVVSVEAFDPVLSATECSVMEEFGFPVMRFDELGRREVKAPTLFFMPHCELQLYDNLLGANWGEGMRRMAILGNSFGRYGSFVEERVRSGLVRVEDAGQRVIGARQFVREVEMEGVGREGEESVDEFFRAFHDMSWHFFELGDNCDVNIF